MMRAQRSCQTRYDGCNNEGLALVEENVDATRTRAVFIKLDRLQCPAETARNEQVKTREGSRQYGEAKPICSGFTFKLPRSNTGGGNTKQAESAACEPLLIQDHAMNNN